MKGAILGVLLATAYYFYSWEKCFIRNTLEDEYDFVIVGAGSAGSIVAARLSEDPNISVALLEAGPGDDDYPSIPVPSLVIPNSLGDLNWFYPYTQVMTSSEGSTEETKGVYHAGRVLGGSSSINFMLAVRGSRHDYDHWAALGNKGWAYEDVLPYFKKLEKVKKPEWIQSGYRGTTGPIDITEVNVYPDLMDKFLEAARSVGHPINNDYNGQDIIGVSRSQVNINGGVRYSTVKAYLKSAMKRPNFHVIVKAFATKVLVEGKKAVGIEYIHGNMVRNVRARKEVIVSAGNIGSAKLLMLSGIGPKDHLTDIGIPLVADLPVGENIKDHVATDALTYTYSKGVLENPTFHDELTYKLFGTGPLSMAGGMGFVHLHSKYQPKNHQYPYLQITYFNGLINSNENTGNDMLNFFNLMDKKAFKESHANDRGKTGTSLFPALMHSEPTMTVRLNSSNPLDNPVFIARFLSDDNDVDMILDGIKSIIAIMESPKMKELGSRRLKAVDPRCKSHEYGSDEFWRCVIRKNIISFLHHCGSCRMGTSDDPTAVVDSELRVYGVDGLRVVDASVMPDIPSGTTNFPTMMIGEKAADSIRGIKP